MPLMQSICRWTGATAPSSRGKRRVAALEKIFLHVGVEKTGTTVPDLRQAAGVTDDKAYAAFLERHPAQIAAELAESGCHTAVFALQLSSQHGSGNRQAPPADVAIGPGMLRDHLPTPPRPACREPLFHLCKIRGHR